MSQFYLHFFKEKSRTLDMEEVIEFFDREDGFEVEMDERSVRFLYTDPNLGYPLAFYITPKSQVPNIQRISPKYLEVNFHLALPILSPIYFVKKALNLVRRICDKFNLFILSEMFSDVLEYNQERVVRVFQMVKKAYIEKYPSEIDKYYEIGESKLNGVLRYIDENDDLSEYYKDLNTLVPKYIFIKDENDTPYIAVEWKENTLTVFPPHLDYVLFKTDNQGVKVISYTEFISVNDKLLYDVPGFLQGTKVINKKTYKKVVNSIKKYKWTPVAKAFARYHLHQLIDL